MPQELVAEERLPGVDVDDAAGNSRKPLGWFIHPLTEMTIHDPRNPVTAMGIPLSRCMRGDNRSQP